LTGRVRAESAQTLGRAAPSPEEVERYGLATVEEVGRVRVYGLPEDG
jgi:hypothetical protein